MFEDIKKVHLIGVGGIGMSALAKLFHAKGAVVSGSDLNASSLTDELIARGMKIFIGHDASQLSEDVDLVIYSSAIPETNPERVAAKEQQIRELTYAEFLGELSKGYSTIAVAGTHGKSSTTAMLSLILEEAGYDPTVIVGSRIPSFKDGNLRIGSGRFFVVEACEYKANLLHLSPEMVVLTNVDEDHLDFYKDIDHIRATFQEFVDKLKGKGMVVWNADDEESKKLEIARGVTFGFGEHAEYRATKRVTGSGVQRAQVMRQEAQDQQLGEMELGVTGAYNMSNALAATAAAMELGVPFETCAKVLKQFVGIWRRFEKLGQWQGATVYSDYGHHPTEVAAVIKASKEFFTDQRVVLCYQPHQHARTIALMDELVDALKDADTLVLTEIYEVAGRTEDTRVSSADLMEKIKQVRPECQVVFAKDLPNTKLLLAQIVKEGDVLIMQGAGSIDDLARELVT
jgi:UDP-N-acetylmuramate--alanine ligase